MIDWYYQPRKGKTMDLHTDNILSGDLYAAAREAGVTIESAGLHGSRSHDHKWSIYLSGSSNRYSNGRDHKAATWDEWGVFMAALYRVEAAARWGTKSFGYADAWDFHQKTQDRFSHGAPQDMHTQHKWQYDYNLSSPLADIAYHYCTGCSARTRRG